MGREDRSAWLTDVGRLGRWDLVLERIPSCLRSASVWLFQPGSDPRKNSGALTWESVLVVGRSSLPGHRAASLRIGGSQEERGRRAPTARLTS